VPAKAHVRLGRRPLRCVSTTCIAHTQRRTTALRLSWLLCAPHRVDDDTETEMYAITAMRSCMQRVRWSPPLDGCDDAAARALGVTKIAAHCSPLSARSRRFSC
jgi:hypothetical protein